MKGDFSRVRFAPHDNFNGILPQQGKVLLDSDGIAQTLIANNWRETAARDWVGKLAGVPSAEPSSFQISAATLSGGVVTLTIGTGHVWADGLLARLGDGPGATVTRTATWIEPPIVPTEGSAADVAAGTMDTVVLEVWQQAVNGFQMPDKLIEPALGGPDTAERLQTAFAFRLARLTAGQTCANLVYDESGRGALTASLVPPVVVSGDCPVVGLGGYSGFEHQLYRIEIAATNAAASQFKWSRTNAGLVGRGAFDPATQTVAITANLPAITSANQTSFYLEIEHHDAALGFSQVIAGAPATLSGGTLQLAATPTFGAYPAAAAGYFFRLWDGISPVASFPISATPVQLENGILLQFDPDGVGKYLPGDFWMFPVRAQGIANPQTLINAKKPQGIRYHRVPLAEITWASAGAGFTAGSIEDCRSLVRPLTQLRGCCTYQVGDGVDSFGDFTSIQAAINALPAEGGEVCILPGRYFENVWIVDRRNVVIHGCGWQTRVASFALAPAGAAPSSSAVVPAGVNPIPAVFSIVASEHIALHSFAVEAADTEAGILIDGTGTVLSSSQQSAFDAVAYFPPDDVSDIAIDDLVVTAATFPAIIAAQADLLRIERNRVAMKNVASLWPAIVASGSDIHIEHNQVGIQTADSALDWLPASVADDLGLDSSARANAGTAVAPQTGATPAGMNPPAAPDTGEIIASEVIDESGLNLIAVTVLRHPGGIQIGGMSGDVLVVDNEIVGGSRNGITLGSLAILGANGADTGQWSGVLTVGEGGDCACSGSLQVSGNNPGSGAGTVVSGGWLEDILIKQNRIRNMGLCGIGPVGYFDLLETLEVITIYGLVIRENVLERTVLRVLAGVSAAASAWMGYGAICIPDVQDLVVADNAITDFGVEPGADACGIFIVHGEMLDISRNQIRETRDWSKAVLEPKAAAGGLRGGIVILFGAPPAFGQPLDDALWADANQTGTGSDIAIAAPVYEPGMPAVRVEHNVVRVPLNYGLFVVGLGPFSIVNSHLACGGLVRATALQLAQTALILNLGSAIELGAEFDLPSEVYGAAQAPYSGPSAANRFRTVSNGTVLFTNNICQLEATVSHAAEFASVFIFTLDSLIFSNNQCWLDATAKSPSALADALLLAGSLNAIGNRFQEVVGSVAFSALTAGLVNITAQNISTSTLFAVGGMTAINNNVAIV
jgi:hypothetical protein